VISTNESLESSLLKLNVNKHKETKQNLSYLSWAWAWATALKADPDANFKVHLFGDKPYMDVNGTAMVWVSVSMGGKSRTCWLPVMNAKNEPIPIAGRSFKDKYGKDRFETVDSFTVNTAIMRCLAKCLAMFGLGLYIYAGEDLPEDESEAKEAVQKEEPKEEPKDEQGIANLKLFAESLVENLSMHDDDASVRSYWKANQAQLDDLKTFLPDVYQDVVKKFKKKTSKE
jgi:Protein of unknown function (DUF1071)